MHSTNRNPPLPHSDQEDPLQDTLAHDDADLDLPGQEALVEAFMAGLSKKVDNESRSLLQLLFTLLDSSLNHRQTKAMSLPDARKRCLISEA